MRVLLKLRAEKFLPGYKVNKHTVQGAIYSLLDDTDFSDLHSKNGFKYFTFSDIFPPGDFYPKKEKTLIISSPNAEFIRTVRNKIERTKYVYLSDVPFHVSEVKSFSIRPTGKFITGSPVVLQVNNEESLYFSFERGGKMRFFMDRIKDNAIKKYNSFYEENLYFEDDIFDLLQFKKEVSVVVKKDDKSFVVIGSMWSLLQKNIPKELRKFYEFITDCGIGEKNSLGFGFLNVVSSEK